jgi:hypothetical protein
LLLFIQKSNVVLCLSALLLTVIVQLFGNQKVVDVCVPVGIFEQRWPIVVGVVIGGMSPHDLQTPTKIITYIPAEFLPQNTQVSGLTKEKQCCKELT